MTLLMRDQEHERIGEERGRKIGEERGEKIGEERGKKIGEKRGKKIGEKQGEERMLTLIEKLVEDNRFDEISKIKEDKQYRQELYKEYHLI